MRITNTMLVNNMINHIYRNQTKMEKFQQQIASGKKITVASDDPIVASRSLKLRTQLSEIEQYERNTVDALSWVETTDATIGNLGDITKRAREIAVQGSNGSNTVGDMEKLAEEIQQLKVQVTHIGNTTYAGKYIFSGYKTDSKLFIDDENSPDFGKFNISVGTDLERIDYEIGVGDSINVNVAGGDLFNVSKDIPSVSGTTQGNVDITTPLNVTLANNTVNLTVDGEVIGIKMPIGSYATVNDIASELEDQINDSTALSKDVIVSAVGSRLLLESTSYGPTSSIVINSGTGVEDLGLSSTTISKGSQSGNSIADVSGKAYGTENVSSFVIDGTNDSLDLTVDGANVSVNLTQKTYTDMEVLAAEIQTQVNAHPSVSDPITVSNLGRKLFFKSGTTGPSSLITIDPASNAADNLGLSLTNSYVGTSAQKGKIIESFDKLLNALKNGDHRAVNETIEDFDEDLTNILRVRADIGARQNRIELTNDRLDSDKVSITKILSENEDVDMAETIMLLTSEENIYNASLSAGAKVIQPTLMDFLR